MLRVMRKMRSLNLSKVDDNYLADYCGCTIILESPHVVSLVNESDLWEKLYLPIDVGGKTVLDVGCGCGETIAFYLAHGAEKVVGIEVDPVAAMFARVNAFENKWNAEIINDPFELAHLEISHDFLKMDIEGAEQILLGYGKPLGPCTIRVHRLGLYDLPKFMALEFRQLRIVYGDPRKSVILNGID